jgi:hypothetical protein
MEKVLKFFKAATFLSVLLGFVTFFGASLVYFLFACLSFLSNPEAIVSIVNLVFGFFSALSLVGIYFMISKLYRGVN